MNSLLLLMVAVAVDASAKTDDSRPDPLPKGEGISFFDDRVTVAPGKGITAKTAEGNFSITLRARAQVRETFSCTNASGAPVREFSRSGWGYFAQAGLMVSRHVELTARWDQLYAFAGTDPSLTTLASTQGRQLGGGVNVYLNGHALKLQADYFYVWGPASSTGRHLARAVIDASF